MIVDDQGKALTSRFQRKKSEIQIATVNQVKEEEISSKSVKSFILFWSYLILPLSDRETGILILDSRIRTFKKK